MALPPILRSLRIPVVGAPLFIISNPELVIAQCISGVVGSLCDRLRQDRHHADCAGGNRAERAGADR